MRDDDPLEDWLFYAEMDEQEPRPRAGRDTPRTALAELSDAIEEVCAGKRKPANVRTGFVGRHAGTHLSPAEAEEAQRLFLALWEHGGAGTTYVLADLLEGIALAVSPISIVFWQQLLDLNRPRDRYVNQRRMYALAALALLAIQRDEPGAYMALAQALEHPHEQVRALGARYLAQAYGLPERPVPEGVAAALAAHAERDPAFAPRFQARKALAQLNVAVPLDPPDRAYLLLVKLRGNPATRTIAALPEDTLADLHYAIQRAFNWDADHLYSFYLNGKRYDNLYEIGCPEVSDDWELGTLRLMTIGPDGVLVPAKWPSAGDDAPENEDEEDNDEEDEEDDEANEIADEGGAIYTTNTQLGALGLVPKHTFLYYFDFGDSHEFDVKVVGTASREPGDYPRLIEVNGEAPRQYHAWDDEEEPDEDGEE